MDKFRIIYLGLLSCVSQGRAQAKVEKGELYTEQLITALDMSQVLKTLSDIYMVTECILECQRFQECNFSHFIEYENICRLYQEDFVEDPGNVHPDQKKIFISRKPTEKKCLSCSDCLDVLSAGHKNSGTYVISNGVSVYCDQETDGGGWTVIQRRKDGSVDFVQEWNPYKVGFGNVEGEFWLGNDNIHRLSNLNPTKKSTLRIDMDVWKPVKYSYFTVGNETNGYKLELDGFIGDGESTLTNNNEQKFSTIDKDQDERDGTHCAQQYKSGWWFRRCALTDLNRKYANMIYDTGDTKLTPKFVEMKIKRNS